MMGYYYLNRPYSDEYLEHHGILGMKWGDRNGPPYPLGRDDHTSRQKALAAKAGVKVGGDSGLGEDGGVRQFNSKKPLQRDHQKQNPTSGGLFNRDKNQNKSKSKTIEKAKQKAMDKEAAKHEKNKSKKGMDPRKKKAIAIGVGVTAGLIAAYAAYRIPKAKKMKENIDSETGLRLKDHAMSEVEDLAAVNKGRRGGLFDQLTAGYSNNCYLCTTTYELRRRGYDVSAKMAWGKNFDYADSIFDNVQHHYDEGNKLINAMNRGSFAYQEEFERNQKSAIDKFYSDAKQMGPNARGNLCVLWKPGGGHSIIWENDSQGKLHLLDAQTNQEYTDLFNDEMLKQSIPADYFRTDNLKLKKSDELKNAVQDNLALDSGLNEKQGAVATAGLSALAGMGVANYYYDNAPSTSKSKNSKSNKKGKNNANRRRSRK